MALARTVLVACLAVPTSSFLLRDSNATKHQVQHPTREAVAVGNTTRLALSSAWNSTVKAAPKPVPAASVQTPEGAAGEAAKLRAKLSKIAMVLSAMLDANTSLSTSRVAGSLSAFAARLRDVVQQTTGMKNATRALQQLRQAQVGMSDLKAMMTSRQEELAKESSMQDQSLLLGVLMVRQHEPMEKQLAVLRSSDFRKLPVVAAVLAAHDTKTPLFQQVAAYLDAHGSGSGAPTLPATATPPPIPAKLKAGKGGKPDVSPIVEALSAQLHKIDARKKHVMSLHRDVMKQLATAQKKAQKKNPRAAKQVQLMARSEHRKYLKQMALVDSDTKNLRMAIKAVQTGDLQALRQSQAALATSMKAAQAQSGGFLYLIQLAHRAAGLDCPYCAAQCIDKCHAASKPYAVCLGQCADAGK